MGERVVYSTLATLPGATQAQLDPLLEMATLWATHLRGPARFGGRVTLLTNVPGLTIDGVECVPTPFAATDRRTLFIERVRLARRLKIDPNGRVMQLDLDALAVAPLDPLFDAVRPGTLSAATSGLTPLCHAHCGQLLTRRQRWMYRLRGWDRRRGVSACVTACDGRSFAPLMRRWSAAIRAVGRDRPVPELGDQTYLNFLFLTGLAPVHRLPAGLIHHVRAPGEPPPPGAAVLHFPLPNKLQEMRRLRRT